jgi:hypothetical protein
LVVFLRKLLVLVKTKILSRLINGSDAAKTKALAYIDTMEARYKECMEEWITSFQDMLKFPLDEDNIHPGFKGHWYLVCRPGIEYICTNEIIITPTVASVPTSPVNTIIRWGVKDSTILSNKIGTTNKSDSDEDHHENGEGYSNKEDGKKPAAVYRNDNTGSNERGQKVNSLLASNRPRGRKNSTTVYKNDYTRANEGGEKEYAPVSSNGPRSGAVQKKRTIDEYEWDENESKNNGEESDEEDEETPATVYKNSSTGASERRHKMNVLASSNRLRGGAIQREKAMKLESSMTEINEVQEEIKGLMKKYQELNGKYSDQFHNLVTMRRTSETTGESPLFGSVYAEVTDLYPSGGPGGGASKVWDKRQDPRITFRVDGLATKDEIIETLAHLRDGARTALRWYKNDILNAERKSYSETFEIPDGSTRTVQIASNTETFGKYIYPPALPTLENNGPDKDLYAEQEDETEYNRVDDQSRGGNRYTTAQRQSKAKGTGNNDNAKQPQDELQVIYIQSEEDSDASRTQQKSNGKHNVQIKKEPGRKISAKRRTSEHSTGEMPKKNLGAKRIRTQSPSAEHKSEVGFLQSRSGSGRKIRSPAYYDPEVSEEY